MKSPLGKLDPRLPDVHIWGGGIAGLLMAHFLSKAGYTIHLYEKAARLGGKLCTHQRSGGVLEEAANAIYATAEIERWLKSLGLNPIGATPSLKRRIWRQGLSSPLSWGLLLRLITHLGKHSPKPNHTTTVADFFRPLLGTYVDSILSPALMGIYARDASELTVTSLWPEITQGRYWRTLWGLRKPKARSVSFPGGMNELVQALSTTIKGTIHLQHQADFQLRPNTVICTDAHTAGEWLGVTKLLHVEYTPVGHAHVHLTTPSEARGVFGCLFPKKSPHHCLGVLFNQEIFPGRMSTSFIYDQTNELPSKLSHDLKILGWPDNAAEFFSWRLGLPIYNQARLEAITDAKRVLDEKEGVVLFGNYVAGISLRDMIQAAQRFAESYARVAKGEKAPSSDLR